MAALVFVLSLVLLIAGAVSGAMSLDLLPTAPGLLYAFAGAVSAVGAVIVFALGVLVARVGRLTTALDAQGGAAGDFAPRGPVEEAGLLAPDVEDVEPEPAPVDAEEPEPQRQPQHEPAPEPQYEPEPTAGQAVALAEGETRRDEEASEEPVNENRAGKLPTLEAIERAIETPEPPPTLIGRYASGGAKYMIFSDGSIEAETDDGAYKFASMGEFKKFLLDRTKEKG